MHLKMFSKTGVLKNFAKFTAKHLCDSLFFNEVAALRIFINRYFPDKFCEVFKNTFFTEHLRWLRLGISIKNLNLFKLLSFSFLSQNKGDMTSQRLYSSLHITINSSLSSIFFILLII